MREILFRGKRKDNGKWVEGFIFVRKDTQGETIDQFIVVDAYEQITLGQRYVRSNLNQECFRVHLETIGQFIGLTDKNGKKIFEGDIMSEHGSLFAVVYDKKWARFKLQHINRGIQYPEWNRGIQMEIVGNIHDNPELLEG